MKKNDSDLIVISDKGKDELEEVGSKFATTYFEFIYDAVPRTIPLIEASDEDLVTLVRETGAVSYLESAEEDIYSLSDGTPL